MTEMVQVLGLEQLREALLRTVPLHFQGAVLQKALLAGAKPMVADAQFRVPTKTWTLYRAIYSYRDRTGSKPTFESRLIGVRKGKSQQKNNQDAYYWRWIEFGRGEINAKPGHVLGTPEHGFFGRTVRAYPGKPFLRPAFDATKEQSLRIITESLAKEIPIAAEKARRAGGFLGREGAFYGGMEVGADLVGSFTYLASDLFSFI